MTDDYHEALRDHRPDRRRAGRGLPHGVASEMNQINGANLLAMRSLAVQAKDSAITTAGNMETLLQHYIALQAENLRLREALEAVQVGKEEEVLRRIEDSRDAPELNSGDMLAFCGSPATSFSKG